MKALHNFLLFHVLTCLGQNALGGVIINGEKAPENSMLYMASLQKGGKHVCGGFLISKDFVITAAHCDGDTVVLGAHNLKSADKIERSIAKKYVHPNYFSVAHGSDIMLLKLSGEVQLGNKVQLIELPSPDMNVMTDQKCSVAGWGYTRTGTNAVDELRVVDVSVISPHVCKELWSGLPANVICAGGYETNKGFCQGDSGGPLVCNRIAVGVVSFNRNLHCDYPDTPNVYTEISKYISWINKILQQKM